MAANRKFSQTSPDRANELFAKLLQTSDGAVKTRERLFSELKDELQLLANLQEQYLFPVLRKHDMGDLLQDAMNDNSETSALLDELDRMPKNSGEFLKKVADLRRVFQQHIRDDKKELLPAVLEVMSEEEVEAVVEKVEDEMAANEQAKRSETEQRPGDMRPVREQIAAVQQLAENVASNVRSGMEDTQKTARSVQDAMQSSLGAMSELAHQSTDRLMQLYGFPARGGQDLAEQTSQHLRAVTQSAAVLTRGMQDISQQWLELSQNRMQQNLERMTDFTNCRSVFDILALQSALVRSNLEQMLDNSRRIAEMSCRVTDEATRTMYERGDGRSEIASYPRRAA